MNEKITLITYATADFMEKATRLIASCPPGIYRSLVFGPSHLSSSFYFANKEILDQKRGAGYWIWKPYIIMTALSEMNDGDILFYMDAGDGFIMPEATGIRDGILEIMKDKDIALTTGGFPNKDWCKRDCFVLMGCDTPEYHDHIQLEAGLCLFRKSQRAFDFLAEWMRYCCDKRIVTDDPNTCGLDNFPSFKEHRWDQAILCNLAIKQKVHIGNGIRKYAKCNV